MAALWLPRRFGHILVAGNAHNLFSHFFWKMLLLVVSARALTANGSSSVIEPALLSSRAVTQKSKKAGLLTTAV
jgi:hypothetical protein